MPISPIFSGGGGTTIDAAFVSMQAQQFRLPAGWSVTFPAVGQALIQTTLANPTGNNFYCPVAVLEASAGTGQIGVSVNAGITDVELAVRTFNSAGVAADLDFFIYVIGPLDQELLP